MSEDIRPPTLKEMSTARSKGGTLASVVCMHALPDAECAPWARRLDSGAVAGGSTFGSES
ncbi:hypothetical protein HEK616_51580 [Streptomyces nigrescens]|uniref:Uncharacterized protein n=1 Tax=Streptomyces nigrescens TaxID=1920 RepID=A0ABM7ZZ62_STRNI|nr:hypothetical protein HEK616_51580 [Streptomyces nigrescens]